jgi:hypothetical protein
MHICPTILHDLNNAKYKVIDSCAEGCTIHSTTGDFGNLCMDVAEHRLMDVKTIHQQFASSKSASYSLRVDCVSPGDTNRNSIITDSNVILLNLHFMTRGCWFRIRLIFRFLSFIRCVFIGVYGEVELCIAFALRLRITSQTPAAFSVVLVFSRLSSHAVLWDGSENDAS